MAEPNLRAKLDHAQDQIRDLERMLETNARDLYHSRESLRRSAQFQENVLRTMKSALVVVDPSGSIVQLNDAAVDALGGQEAELLGARLADFLDGFDGTNPIGSVESVEVSIGAEEEGSSLILFSSTPMVGDTGDVEAYVCVWADLSEKKQLEIELRHAQKLESLGQMAAGVAHEINTPIQFVGDSLHFLRDAFEDLQGLLESFRSARDTWGKQEENGELAEASLRLENEIDIEFIEAEAPGAFARAVKGLDRVAEIVRALKSFSHPGTDDMAPTDLNETIETTVTLARNEYKYVADVSLELGELSEVWGHAGDLGQVFLNLVVNAAHAIQDRVESREGDLERGDIVIRTSLQGDFARVDVEDTGTGIPDEVRNRIFDPFFTTKEVGRGTGQGLSITQRIVVQKHGGRLEVDSVPGQGTTFRVFLPLARGVAAA